MFNPVNKNQERKRMSIHSVKIAPSILSANFACLGQEVKALTNAGADWIHIDIMDGHFVQNLTIGPAIVKAMRPYSHLPFDVHLMIDPVQPFIQAFIDVGADQITTHVELPYVAKTIALIKNQEKKAGLAISPETPAEALFPYLNSIDLILVMTVHPGFGGQRFMENQLEKIKILKEKIQSLNLSIDLAVDGGITSETGKKAIQAGANVLIAGTTIFKNSCYADNISALRNAESPLVATKCHPAPAD